ncbi:hypothetical protein J6590_094225 [Homalodisca vitripennis]|nr:hypothetical protein J6590_094225 [Homalodisca vitripennis]
MPASPINHSGCMDLHSLFHTIRTILGFGRSQRRLSAGPRHLPPSLAGLARHPEGSDPCRIDQNTGQYTDH